jgi:hypothetical protein
MLRGILRLLALFPVFALAEEAPSIPAAWYDVGANESAIVVNLYQDISPQFLEISGEEGKKYTYRWDEKVPLLAQFRVPPGEYEVVLPFESGRLPIEAKDGQITLLEFSAFAPTDTKVDLGSISPEDLKSIVAKAESEGVAIDPSISYIFPTAATIDIRAKMPPGVRPPPKPEPPSPQ